MRVTVSRMLRRDVRRGKHFITLAHSFRIIILSQSNTGTKNLKKLREGLVLLSRDRQVVYSFHETFEMVDEMLELVDQLIEKESEN